MSKKPKASQLAYQILNTFPKSKKGEFYLTTKRGRKLYFNLFIKKYGLDGTKVVYGQSDLRRRLRMIEFFDYFVKTFSMKKVKSKSGNRYIIESHFYRMVISSRMMKGRFEKLEVLSFYPIN